MTDKESRFDDKPPATPPPSPLRASNTLESLKPREVLGYKVVDMSIPTQVTFNESSPGVVRPEPVFISGFDRADAVQKTDTPPLDMAKYTPIDGWPETGNVLPVNWPASTNKPPTPVLLPSVYDRVVKLEEQVDSLLDRIAKHNQRSSHKI